MLGLIFLTWEKYVTERFGEKLLLQYRSSMGEAAATALVAGRYYDDALLVKGVETVCQLTRLPSDVLLREYGRYYMTNGLTGKLCAYLLTGVHSGEELLLAMRDSHARLRTTFEGATPPAFEYGATNDPHTVVLLYRSERHLCPVLHGAIEGAAMRYHEVVHIQEQTCMNRGANACRFEARFFPNPSTNSGPLAERESHQLWQRQLADLILVSLPPFESGTGWTLRDIGAVLSSRGAHAYYQRPAVLLEAVQHLQFAGLIRSSANEHTDAMMTRRYWRTPSLA